MANLHGQSDQAAIIDEGRITSKLRLEQAMYGEANVSGFCHYDQEVCFFTQVAALLRPHHVVLDFGAGRGEWFYDDPVRYRRLLQDFRGTCAHVDGCDVDPAVLGNPALHEAKVFTPGAALPYEDDRFDLIVSRYVFEHIEDPSWAASELLRITKPGGWICAATPNKYGYVALASRLMPNRLHATLLRRIQPHRKEADVFPTVYRLNTPSAIRHHFGHAADIFYYRDSAVPSYHFGNAIMFRLLQTLHRFLPTALGTGFYIFIRRRT